MTARAAALMQVFGTDIYAGFVPMFPTDLQGWNSRPQVFRDIIPKERPSIVIDVGVWKGARPYSWQTLCAKMKSTAPWSPSTRSLAALSIGIDGHRYSI